MKRVRRAAILLFVGVVLGVLLVLITEKYGAEWSRNRWLIGALYTGLTFLFLASELRQHWRAAHFRATFLLLLAAHCVAYSLVLLTVSQWRSSWSMFIAIVEVVVISRFLWDRGFE